MKTNDKLILKQVTHDDIKFLYQILSERPRTVNISHKTMPSFYKHSKFVKSNPYVKWYVIHLNDVKNGSAYITQINEITIHLIRKYENDKLKDEILTSIIKQNPHKRYIVNLNPKNKKGIEFYKKRGFKLVQYSYELLMD